MPYIFKTNRGNRMKSAYRYNFLFEFFQMNNAGWCTNKSPLTI